MSAPAVRRCTNPKSVDDGGQRDVRRLPLRERFPEFCPLVAHDHATRAGRPKQAFGQIPDGGMVVVR